MKRCTGCKQDVGEYGIRHKYAGGVFCEDCMRSLGIHRGGIQGFWGRAWNWIADLATSIFRPETPSRIEKRRREEKIQVHAQVMKARALRIPTDPQSVSAR